jgi:hypothetical protein
MWIFVKTLRISWSVVTAAGYAIGQYHVTNGGGGSLGVSSVVKNLFSKLSSSRSSRFEHE